MPGRGAPSKHPPKPARSAAEAPSRDALLAALAARDRELAEARAQQAALAEVLETINASPDDLARASDAIVETAIRLCDATGGGLWRVEGEAAHAVTGRALPEPFMDYASRAPPRLIDLLGRNPQEQAFCHIEDVKATRAYHDRAPFIVASADLASIRTYLGVPLCEDGAVIGVFTLIRDHVRPFTERQIALVRAFAAQAQIAMTNARLFNETREALERQTATAEVLKVIAGSPSDTQPVFEAIAASANRLLGGFSTTVIRFIGDVLHLVAFTPTNPAADEALQATFPRPIAEFPPFLLVRDGDAQQFVDTEAESGVPPVIRDLARLRGYRSMLFTPLMAGGAAIGMISVTREDPGAFAADDVQLLRTFADQAVIAIQNAKLFNETKEALERQTATANVLKVISRSVSDAAPVFETILESCQRLFGLDAVAINLVEGDMVRGVAHRGWSQGDWGRDETPLAESATGAAIAERRAIHIPDLAEKPGLPERFVAPLREAGGMSVLYAPMLWEDRGVGSIVVSRKPAKPFSDKEVALAQSFADQAAIAIQNARLFNETQEALEQQKASADVLGAISKSVADTAPVFETIIDACQRLFGGEEIGIYTIGDDDMVRVAAWRGDTSQEARRDVTPVGESVTGRIVRERRVRHIPDLAAEPGISPTVRERAERLGSASLLYAPMLSEDRGLGSILVVRSPPRPFSQREQALLQTFADQAAIAVENARLFEAVQARTRDLSEALQQQTATADVLKVISRSAFDLQAVLDTLTASATKLCDGDRAAIFQRRGDLYHFVSNYGFSDEMEAFARANPLPVGSSGGITRAGRDRKSIHIPDVLADPEYTQSGYQSRGDYRTLLSTPLMRAGEPIGGFVITRKAVRPFNDRQIEVLQTFADQAVIAIENVRLFDEVQEALERETATSEILRVISQSPTDARPVFDAIVLAAVRSLRCDMAFVQLRDGDGVVTASGAGAQGLSPELPGRVPLDPAHNFPARAILSGETLHVPDWAVADLPEHERNIRAATGANSALWLPLMRERECVGVIGVGGTKPNMFGPKEIAQAESFRDQALIAIENTRLFNETQEALQQQTATADVLKVISRSAFDLEKVLDTLTASAVSLCGAHSGIIYLRSGDRYELKAATEEAREPELFKRMRAEPLEAGRGTAGGRVVLTGEVHNIPDVLADPDFDPARRTLMVNRALLGVPLKRGDDLVGAFVLARGEPGAFNARQVQIVQTFADQAVIAIENVRLFNEVQARTHELAASLDTLHKAQDRLVQSEKLASLGQLTAGIAHEIKNPLNFINNFSALSRELMEELRDILGKAGIAGETQDEADELIGMIDANLDKVVSHGRRADSIVKNMLLHSREGSGERGAIAVNAMVEEALNLAYHGARAEKRAFNVTIEKVLDPAAGEAELSLQDVTRVLLNLISNAFYATTKRKETDGDGYEPTLVASTRDLGQSVEIVIRDNGAGIPDEVKAKMFNPFFTTKPAGEGTGLGLSLSHDIVVKQHGGAIEVATEPGVGTEFTITLPREGARP